MGNERTTHPLLQKQFGDIRNWAHWKELWESAKTTQELIGLLHCGLDLNGETEAICFYLEIADGYRYESNFSANPPDNFSERHNKTCQKVAEKAYKVLCQKFFKNTNAGYRYSAPSWFRAILDKQLFEKIFWFFDGRDNGPTTLDSDHGDEICADFLRGFVEAIWRPDSFFGRSWGSGVDRATAILDAAQPRSIKLLFDHFRDTSIVFEVEVGNVKEETMKALEEIAIRHHNGGKYASIEEAYLDRNRAAGAFILLRTKKKEWQRREEIRKAEEQKAAAERALKKLGK